MACLIPWIWSNWNEFLTVFYRYIHYPRTIPCAGSRSNAREILKYRFSGHRIDNRDNKVSGPCNATSPQSLLQTACGCGFAWEKTCEITTLACILFVCTFSTIQIHAGCCWWRGDGLRHRVPTEHHNMMMNACGVSVHDSFANKRMRSVSACLYRQLSRCTKNNNCSAAYIQRNLHNISATPA